MSSNFNFEILNLMWLTEFGLLDVFLASAHYYRVRNTQMHIKNLSTQTSVTHMSYLVDV